MLAHPMGCFSVSTLEPNPAPIAYGLASTIAETPFCAADRRSGLRIRADDSPSPLHDLASTALGKRWIRLCLGRRPHHVGVLPRYSPCDGFSNIRAITHSISPSRRYVHVDGPADARLRRYHHHMENILRNTVGTPSEIRVFSPKFE